MICEICGYSNNEASKFCVKCGAKLLLNTSVNNKTNNRKLAYVVSENEILDEVLLNNTINKNMTELVSYTCTNVMNKKCFKYDVNNVISIKEFLSKQIKKREFITLLINLVNSFISVQALGIKLNNVFMNLNQIFINPINMNIKLLCIPISNRNQENSIKGTIHDVIVSCEFDYNENCKYIKDIMEFVEADKSDDVNQLMALLIKYDEEIIKEKEIKSKVNNNISLDKNRFSTTKETENSGTTILEDPDELDGTTVLVDEDYCYPYLVRKNTDEKIIIDKSVFRIGKDSMYADYVVKDNTAVSRKHAEIMVQNGVCYIVDLGSTNHTFINGQRIKDKTEVEIPQNAIIKLANEEFFIYVN